MATQKRCWTSSGHQRRTDWKVFAQCELMWADKTARKLTTYSAVEAMVISPVQLASTTTWKDLLSTTIMTPEMGNSRFTGTVIISAVAECSDIRKTISPDLKPVEGSSLLYIAFSNDDFKLGGSSFAQIVNQLGNRRTNHHRREIFYKKLLPLFRAYPDPQDFIRSRCFIRRINYHVAGNAFPVPELCKRQRQRVLVPIQSYCSAKCRNCYSGEGCCRSSECVAKRLVKSVVIGHEVKWKKT